MSSENTVSKDSKGAKGKSPEASKKKSSKDSSSASAIEVSAERPKVSPGKTPRLKVLYKDKVVAQLQKELGLTNSMQVPRLEKIVVSTCLKEALLNPKVLDTASDEIALITGQRPRVTRSKKSIAAFKLRKGISLGAMVTLRHARMYEFLDRLINVALPRVRDFKGLNSKSFDGRGNYSMGVKEQIIFPEINYDRIDKIRGLNVTICTSATNNDHARALLTHLGMPFRKA